ncbi:MAG: phosphoribosylformylglycinamidine synthase, partial [Verrucomicrobiaceae bacterium]
MNRIFVEKKPGFDVEARHLLHDLRESLDLPDLAEVRIIQRYDIDGLTDAEFQAASKAILTEPQMDFSTGFLSLSENETAFAVEYLPGQFDQRADSAAQCVQILTGKERPDVFSSRIYVLAGDLSGGDIAGIKAFVINEVDSHEIDVDAPY